MPRTLSRKIADLEEDEVVILQHFLLYNYTDGQEGHNPYKPSYSDLRRLLRSHRSYDTFRTHSRKVSIIAQELIANDLTGKCRVDCITCVVAIIFALHCLPNVLPTEYILDQCGYTLDEGVQDHPLLGDDIDLIDPTADATAAITQEEPPPPEENTESMPTTPMKTAAKPPRAGGSSTKKAARPPTPLSTKSTAEEAEEAVNELLPRVLAFEDEETLFVTGFPLIWGHSKKNRRFGFSEDGRKIKMDVKVSKALRTAEGLLEGFENSDDGTMWRRFMQLAIRKLYGGRVPVTPAGKHVWKTMFELDLTFEVEKKFYKTGVSSLIEIGAPVLQSDGEIGWFACYLKKKYLEDKEVDGRDTAAIGKGAILLAKMAAMNCESDSVFVHLENVVLLRGISYNNSLLL